MLALTFLSRRQQRLFSGYLLYEYGYQGIILAAEPGVKPVGHWLIITPSNEAMKTRDGVFGHNLAFKLDLAE